MNEPTPIDFNVKRMNNKRKRRRKHRIQFFLFFLIVLDITLLLLYMFSSISYVHEVNIKGNHLISNEEVRKVIKIKKTDRIYTLSIKEKEQNLALQDGVKAVDIKRHLPNIVTVHIEEFKVVGIVYNDKKKKRNPVLENGQVLTSKDVKDVAPIINDFNSKELKMLVKILNKTDQQVVNQISEINFIPHKEASSRVQFFMTDGLEVIGDLRTLNDKLNYYPSMAKAVPRDKSGRLVKAGVIDLEVGSVFIPYETKKGEERRLKIEEQFDKNKETEDKRIEQSITELQQQLNDISKAIKEVGDPKQKENGPAESIQDRTKVDTKTE